MTIERLDDLSGVNENGEIVPIDDVPELEDTPPNGIIIDKARSAALAVLGITSAGLTRPIAKSPETQPGLVYPRSVIEARSRLAVVPSVDEEDRDTYADLGGGLADRNRDAKLPVPLEASLGAYEPWHRDTRIAVEQYGVLELAQHGGLEAMNAADRNKFAHHFFGFMHRLSAQERMIRDVEGDGGVDYRLRELYGTHTPAELLDYAGVLRTLRDELKATGIPDAVLQELKIPNGVAPGSVSTRGTYVLRELQQDIRRSGNVRVGFSPKGLPRIERFKGSFKAVG